MNTKMDWMLGMTQNMMNMAEKNMHMPVMNEMYALTSTMMGNLNHMKMCNSMPGMAVEMMESMMRNMENMMMNMDMNSDSQKMMMKSMMNYMVMMQMSMMMSMMYMK